MFPPSQSLCLVSRGSNYNLVKWIFPSINFIADCADSVGTTTIIQMTTLQMNLVTKYSVHITGERIYARPSAITGRFLATTVLQGKCAGISTWGLSILHFLLPSTFRNVPTYLQLFARILAHKSKFYCWK